RQKRLEALGVEVVATPWGESGMDLRYVLEDIGSRGVRGVLVEGGGDTAGRFLRSGLVDKMTVFYAPKVLGADGVPMIGALGLTSVQDAPRFCLSGVEPLGDDLAVTFYPRKEGADVHGLG
ncbi:MAG TPA: RibD family protein, partial [Rubrobacteraceae bacterium]|nr:RibD family protein [Rubrobacteraceae bacterium]